MQWEGYTFDDSNGDGVGDVGHADLNGDGQIDSCVSDTNLDGYVDTHQNDLNADGYFEGAGYDQNQDGAVESVAVDTDANGSYDSVALDSDQNGVAERYEMDRDGDGVRETVALDDNQDSVIDAQGEANPFTGRPGPVNITIGSDPGGAVPGGGGLGPLGPLYETNEALKDPNVTRILADIQDGIDDGNKVWTMPDNDYDID